MAAIQNLDHGNVELLAGFGEDDGVTSSGGYDTVTSLTQNQLYVFFREFFKRLYNHN